MVDNLEEKKISEFMYRGMDDMAGQEEHNTSIDNHLIHSRRDTTSSKGTGKLRQMSEHVKTLLSEAKQALHLDSGEDLNTMTINEEV